MAETEELKQMILSFRRAELVDLLGYVGMNKVGVKATLLQRAVSLINSSRGCSVPVQIKIRELYRQIHNPFASEPPRARPVVRGQPPVVDPRGRRVQPAKTGSSLPMPSLPSSMTGAVDYSKRGSESLTTPSLPVHPEVTLKRLPFYDIMGELLKPTSLVPSGPSRYQETYYVFHLTPQQAQDIAMSRDLRQTAKCEFTVQVQLRFCFLEKSGEQDDNFPPSICVRVNGKVAQLPNPIPTTKPGVEPKRPGRPVDITSLCRISPTMPNHVEISWASEYGRGYCVSINLVKRLTSDILLGRLKQFGQRHADLTRSLIKEKLAHDPDSGVETTSLRLSLMCPLGKMRIQLPSRAATCSHIQCFDATTFLMMNEKKATWLCPICDKPAPFHKLIIDGLFVEILRKVTDLDEIQFVEDGSWEPIRNNKETHVINSTVTPQQTIDLDKTVNLCGDSPSETSSEPPTKKPKMDFIDLTETDSEDEADNGAQSRHDISSGSSTPSLIMNPSVVAPSPPAPLPPNKSPAPGLPPMPPLMHYIKHGTGSSHSNNSINPKKSLSSTLSGSLLSSSSAAAALSSSVVAALSSSSSSSSRSGGSSSSNGGGSASGGSGLNLSLYYKHGGQWTTMPDSGSTCTVTPSWLTALSNSSLGHKRPPPAHSNSQPTHKRPMMEKLTDSPSSSNSNMSPLVDLDQLCSILDSDRDRHTEEISNVMPFPPEFSLTPTAPFSSSSNSRNCYNPSPSDVISLD